ncbi:cell division control protein [Tulasnella sp. 425]|nr:cell division control protein [Tulasnella sp. 425]
MAFVFAVTVENGVRLRLNTVDTPSYGDQINNEGGWDTIIKYIKHSAYLPPPDTPFDIIVMKKLREVVNVVPIIAKADSLTLEEREVFKNNIRAEIQCKNIRLYPFDTDENDPEELALNETIGCGSASNATLFLGKDGP